MMNKFFFLQFLLLLGISNEVTCILKGGDDADEKSLRGASRERGLGENDYYYGGG
eukprot:CAMPEP_0202458766 /NCGR_PEP_ID=MMETSP1360-20130828/27934_1 /ASSEMBLY_ACC=CAM_ASM_000848 /TAXON_ID=515479 /ORGANISM="Licmophora paradoxa, Strain CCMP2313" /LENGTH=54 /DNA_ID=CAMNT_0049079475 /DNA_START=40 /DNA_END=200 /DNA_ORIENTATION=-